MDTILGAVSERVNNVHPVMDSILSQFCQTGRLGEPEALRCPPEPGRSAELRDRVRAAGQAHEARKADSTPLDRAAAWLFAQLPGLATFEEAREVVAFTVARAGAHQPLTFAEHIIVDVWYDCVAAHREACRDERLRGGTRG